MVSQVFYINQNDKFPQIEKDVREIRNHVRKNQAGKEQDSIFCVLQTIPPVRRISSLPQKIENGDVLPAFGVAALAFANLPTDIKDMRTVGEQVSLFFDGKIHHSVLDYYKNQKSFSFLKGTLFQIPIDWLHQTYPNFAKKITNWDKSIFDTCLGKGLAIISETFGKTFRNWSVRAFKRTTILGVLLLSAFELPKISREISKGKTCEKKISNGAKQSAKSAFTVASTTASIAYMGALGAKYGGLFGSLAGMGAGAILGNVFSNKLLG